MSSGLGCPRAMNSSILLSCGCSNSWMQSDIWVGPCAGYALACAMGRRVGMHMPYAHMELTWGWGYVRTPGTGLGLGIAQRNWHGTGYASTELELAWGRTCARRTSQGLGYASHAHPLVVEAGLQGNFELGHPSSQSVCEQKRNRQGVTIDRCSMTVCCGSY